MDTTRDDVKSMYNDWIGGLVSNYSGMLSSCLLKANGVVDGLRIDTARHVQKDFWRPFNDNAGVYCVGEVFQGDPQYTCPYQDVMDGVLNYPMYSLSHIYRDSMLMASYYPLRRAFQSTSGSMSELADMINTVKSTCADSTLLGNFIENHDNPRFASYVSLPFSITIITR